MGTGGCAIATTQLESKTEEDKTRSAVHDRLSESTAFTDILGKVAVVIPCYNHGNQLPQMLGRIHGRIGNPQIVVVDDGSSVPLRVPYGGALVIRHLLNQGKSEAVRTGLSYLNSTVQVVVFMDADGQHDPDDILKVMEPILNGKADISIGSRFSQTRNGVPFRHLLANKVVSILFSMLFRRRISDVLCGFRAVRRNLLDTIPLRGHGYTVECEMLILALRRRARVVEVPVYVGYGEKSSVVRGVRLTIRLILYILLEAVRPTNRGREDPVD